jgi:periplasmic protein TonB
VATRAAEAVESPDLLAADRALIEPPKRGSNTFWIGLALAVMLHLAPFLASALGVVSLVPMRRMGELDGDPEGISVEVVDEAALASLSPLPTPPTPTPPPQVQPPPPVQMPPMTQSAPPVQQAQPPPATPEIRGTTPAESPPDSTTEEAPAEKPVEGRSERPPEKQQPEKQPPQKQPPAKAPPQAKAEPADILKEMREIFAPDPLARNKTPAPSKEASQQTPPAQNAPPSVLDRPIEFQANSSSFARPTDATRSGENDDFGRGVIKALRQTMPVPWGIKSRVTIKFLLSESGQVIEMQLVKGSGYPLVDQSVVFAAGNSTFPVPPRGSTLSDRIFMVTYIYD